jgi:hypothetical protein
MTDTLLKWVAEELLRWPYTEGFVSQGQLQSWHGIGLVVDAMARQSPPEQWERFIQLMEEPHEQGPWWAGPAPWDHAFAAARKAVEGR